MPPTVGHARPWVGVCLGLSLAVGTGQAPLTSSTSGADLEVLVVNQAGISSATLEGAQSNMTTLFAKVGVNIRWVSAVANSGRRSVSILLTREPMLKVAIRPGALGLAVSTPDGYGRVAYVFYQRIADVARRHLIDVPTLLSIAMAHEIGHLLVRGIGHDDEGLMKEEWSARDFRAAMNGTLAFAPVTALAIRGALLSNHASPHLDRGGDRVGARRWLRDCLVTARGGRTHSGADDYCATRERRRHTVVG